MAQDILWQNIRKPSIIQKLRGTLVIPAFSISCGQVHQSLLFSQLNSAALAATAVTTDHFANAFTVEAWIKNISPADATRQIIVANRRNISTGLQWELSIIGLKLNIRLLKSATMESLLSADNVPLNEWCHVAATWDGTTAKLYVNKVLQANSLAVASPLDPATADNHSLWLGGGDPYTDFRYIGYLDEVRVWSLARSKDDILNYSDSPRGIAETGLVYYYKFNETYSGVTGTALNSVVAIGGTLSFTIAEVVPSEDSAPLKFGASFVAGRIPISTDRDFSLQFPPEPPTEDCNFCLVVAWSPSTGIVTRYRLWTVGEDIAPELPFYRGQVIPSECWLEIWNIDGNFTVDLEAAYTLVTTLLHNRVDVTDSVPPEESDTDIDTSLAESFPWTPFPLVFNETQTY